MTYKAPRGARFAFGSAWKNCLVRRTARNVQWRKSGSLKIGEVDISNEILMNWKVYTKTTSLLISVAYFKQLRKYFAIGTDKTKWCYIIWNSMRWIIISRRYLNRALTSSVHRLPPFGLSYEIQLAGNSTRSSCVEKQALCTHTHTLSYSKLLWNRYCQQASYKGGINRLKV